MQPQPTGLELDAGLMSALPALSAQLASQALLFILLASPTPKHPAPLPSGANAYVPLL